MRNNVTVSPFKSYIEHFPATICFGKRETSRPVQKCSNHHTCCSVSSANLMLHHLTCELDSNILSPSPGVGDTSVSYISKCFWLCPELIFWHHQRLCSWCMQIGEGQSELATLIMCCLTILSIAFITREVRVTGLNLLSALVVHFLGMRITVGLEVFENIPFINNNVMLLLKQKLFTKYFTGQ